MASSCNRKTNPSAQPPKPAAPSKTEFQIETPTGEAETLPRFLGMDEAGTLRSFYGWETIFLSRLCDSPVDSRLPFGYVPRLREWLLANTTPPAPRMYWVYV